MNCVECQTDPLTPGHYCPCCGRKLSLQELRAMGAAPVDEQPRVSERSPDAAVSAVEDPRRAVAPPPVADTSHELTQAVVRNVTTINVTRQVAVPPPVAEVNTFRTDTAKAVADLTAKAHLARAENPAPVIRRPIVASPPPPQKRTRTPMMVALAAVIVFAIGAAEGARRLGYQWPSRMATPEEQPVEPMPAVEGGGAAKRPETSPENPVATKVVAEKRASARAPLQAATRPKAKIPNSAAQQAEAVPVVAPVRAPVTPAPVATVSPVVAVAEPQRVPEPPSGRFFERSDVDEVPRIVTRVEPRLPSDLAARASNAIVIVRVLVSRIGHPFHVSVLRGSMLGRATDDAVVAAVAQWTFSPAKKRGEPVNCWYNIGVPLNHAN